LALMFRTSSRKHCGSKRARNPAKVAVAARSGWPTVRSGSAGIRKRDSRRQHVGKRPADGEVRPINDILRKQTAP
jgi:hypothetical protein